MISTKHILRLVAVLFLFNASIVLAGPKAPIGILDATKDLEGKTVIVAGDIEELPRPHNLLRFQYRNVCFTTDISACSISCKGFIAVGRDNIPYFFSYDNIRRELRKYDVNLFMCPEIP